MQARGKIRASDISRKKKQNFAGFSGANSRKNRPISREKSQNSRKNRPISLEKSQNSPENRSISRDFSGKKSNFEGFSGANSQKNRPISREISGGNFAQKQSTVRNYTCTLQIDHNFPWSTLSLRFTLSLQSAVYTKSAFYPWSAVCTLQSAVCVLH